MFNSGKHFLTGLMNRLGTRRERGKGFFSRPAVDYLRTRQMTVESLEDRQLLAITTAEKIDIAAAYADFGITANDNFIEITANNLTRQSLEDAIGRASRTSASDVIVLRTSTQNFTLELGNTPLIIDVNSAIYGDVTIVGYGSHKARLVSQTGTAIQMYSGNIELGNLSVVGVQSGTSSTPIEILKTSVSAKLKTQDVTLSTQTYWTKALPGNETAVITELGGIYSVDFPITIPNDPSITQRAYITGLTSRLQADELLNVSLTHSTKTHIDGTVDNYYFFEADAINGLKFRDAEIANTRTVDQNLSWAAVASNMLAQTGWGNRVSTDEQALLDYFIANFTDEKFYVEGGLEWFMNGAGGMQPYGPTYGPTYDNNGAITAPGSNDVWAQIDSDGGNLFGPTFPFAKYGGTYNSRNYYSTQTLSPLVGVSQLLNAGYAVGTNISSLITTTVTTWSFVMVDGLESSRSITGQTTTVDYRYATSAISIFGYVYDPSKQQGATDYYTYVFATDPKDDATGKFASDKLELYKITWQTNSAGLMAYSYELTSCGHNITVVPADRVYGTSTTTTNNGVTVTTRTDTQAITRSESVGRMTSFVYLAMAEGYAPVEHDAYEPNDSAATVDGRPVNKIDAPTSNLGIVSGTLVIDNLNLVTDDPEDWYKFKTDQPCSIADSVTIDYVQTLFSGGVQFYLYVRDNNGKLVLLQDYQPVTTKIIADDIPATEDHYRVTMSLAGLPKGDYYIRVTRANVDVDCKNYKLTIATCSDDRYEVNNVRQDCDNAVEGAVNSPNLGPIMVPELVLSDLILKQATPSYAQTSEVDAFRFVLTGVGGANSYIEIRYQGTSQLPNDADLDLYLYKAASAAYYAQYPTAWGDLVGQSTSSTNGIERISLEGFQPGVYYIKAVGYVNSSNLLNYKLIIHLRDETDAPGIGITNDPDYLVNHPVKWESPIVVSDERYETYDPEKSNTPVFSTDRVIFTGSDIYVNVSMTASANSGAARDVEIGIYINGNLCTTFTTTIAGSNIIEDTDRLLAKFAKEFVLTYSNGELWELNGTQWTDTFKEGMVLSLLNDHGFVQQGYVLMNGTWVSVTPMETKPDNGTVLSVNSGNTTTDLVYYNVNFVYNNKKYTDQFVDYTNLWNITGTTNEVWLLSGSAPLKLNYNANTKVFTQNGYTYTVPSGSALYIPVTGGGSPVSVTFVRYERVGANVMFYKSYFDLDQFMVEKVSDTTYTVSPVKPLVMANGTVLYYRSFAAGSNAFYSQTNITAGSTVTFMSGGNTVSVIYKGIYQGSDPNNLYPHIAIGEGMFLQQYEPGSTVMYYGNTAVTYNSATKTFRNNSTGATIYVPVNTVLKAQSPQTNSNAQGILFDGQALFKSYEFETAATIADDTELLVTTGTYTGWTVRYNNGEFFLTTSGLKIVVANGTELFDFTVGNHYRYGGVAAFTLLTNTIPDGSVTIAGTSYQHESGYFYAYYGVMAENTSFTYSKGTVAETTLLYKNGGFYEVKNYSPTITAGNLKAVWKDGYFFECRDMSGQYAFAQGSQFVFYTDPYNPVTLQNEGFGASYIKITPPSATSSQAAWYVNAVSFSIDPNDQIKEYIETNNTASTTFSLYRYQDDRFVPNASKSEVDHTTNADVYNPQNNSNDPGVHYNPNLGIIIGGFMVDNLALLTPEDWFSFELVGNTNDTNYVQIQFDPSFGDLDLYIYKVDADYPGGYRLFGYSANVGSVETVSLAGGGAGTYYVRVLGFRGDTNPYYKLTVVGANPIDPSAFVPEASAKAVNSSVLISWQKQGDPAYVFGGASEYFTSTEVRIWADGQSEVEAITYTVGRGVNSLTISNLDPDTKYWYSVVCNNPIGSSQSTPNQFFVTDDFLADSKYYGLVIGVSEYRHYSDLTFALTDAKGVYNALNSAQPQWNSANLTLLTGNVSQRDISEALKAIGSVAKENDVVFIYYVGLGYQTTVGGEFVSYLSTYDAYLSPDDFSSLVSSNLNVAQIQTVLNPYFVNTSISNPVYYDYESFATSLIDAYAGKQTNVSVMTTADYGQNGNVNSLGNDVFGQALIDAMSQKIEVNGEEYYVADLEGNADHRLSFTEIYNYVYGNVTGKTGNLQTPQLYPQFGNDSIVIKGEWKEVDESSNYNYFKDEWWANKSIVVTTSSDVVDCTDGEVSLREAIKYLGTVLTHETRLLDGTDVTLPNGTVVSYSFDNATSSGIIPGVTLTINGIAYRYEEGIFYTSSGTTVFLKSGTVFTRNNASYTYVCVNGYNQILDALGIDVTATFFDTPTTPIMITLANGNSVTIRQTGKKIESMVMDTITFRSSLMGTTLTLRKELVFDDSTAEYIDLNGNMQLLASMTIDASNLSGSYRISGDGLSRHFNVSSQANIPVSFIGLVLNNGVEVNGGSILNSGNVWVINSLLYGNTAAINGGAIYSTGSLTIVNSTISANSSGIVNQGGNLTVYNSIVFANVGTDIVSPTANVLYSLVGTGFNAYAYSNTNLNPIGVTTAQLFKDFVNYDFHIIKGAPVINIANPALAQKANGERLTTDLDGTSRSVYGGVDMGAYEWVDPNLKLDSIVTTLSEDNTIDSVISLREAISYVGTWYTTDDVLTDIEGQQFTLKGSTVFAEGGAFYTHSAGYYFKVGNVKTALAVGDYLTNYANGRVYHFNGTRFVDGAGVALADPSTAVQLVLTKTDGSSATGTFSNFISVAYGNYAIGDSILYSDGTVGVIRKNPDDGKLAIRKTIQISSTIRFDLAAIKANYLASGKTDADWDFMLDTTGLVFELDNATYNGALEVYRSLTIDINSVNVTGADKAKVIAKGITITLKAGSNDRILDVNAGTNDQVLLRNVKLTGLGVNLSIDGGAIFLEGGELTLDNVIVSNNRTSGSGGAIYVAANTSLTVTNSSLFGNIANSGGAIYVASATPGGIGGHLTISATNVYNNAANFGGAVSLASGATASISSSNFYSNLATNRGGAFYNAGTLNFVTSAGYVGIYENSAQYGGGIYNATDGIVEGTKIYTYNESALGIVGNTAAIAGGFAYNEQDAKFTINSSRVYYNTATNQGGGFYNVGALLINTTDIAGNTTTSTAVGAGGAAIYDAATKIAVMPEGNGYSTTLVNSMIRGNQSASYGGAIYASGSANVHLIYTTIVGNIAGLPARGNGIYLNGVASLYLESSVVAKNTATSTDYADIILAGTGTVLSSYSFIGFGGNLAWDDPAGKSIIGTTSAIDPRFVSFSASSDWRTWDLTPSTNELLPSPLVNNAKDITSFINLHGRAISIIFDFTGLRYRIIDDKSDMGAYESGIQTERPTTVVTTWLDVVDESDGLISLREAILYASAAEYYGISRTITFDASIFGGNDRTIILDWMGGMSLVLNDYCIIDTTNSLTGKYMTIKVSGGDKVTVFQVKEDANVEIKGLHIINGYAKDQTVLGTRLPGRGGAVNIEAGTLRLTNVYVYGNKADDVGGGFFQSGGNLVITQCDIYDNHSGLALYPGYSDTGGGAIRSSGGRLQIFSSTIAMNSAITYGGIYATGSFVSIYNTIIAKNTDGVADNGDLYAQNLSDVYHCVIGVMRSGQSLNGINGNIVGTVTNPVDPRFTDADNYDFTLKLDSPAVNTGNNKYAKYPDGSAILVDIQGNLRHGVIDIGAFESGALDPMSTVVTTLKDIEVDDGLISIREAIQKAVLLGTTITFNIAPEDLGTQTITLTDGELRILQDYNITIDARINGYNGEVLAGGITINAAGKSQIFSVVNSNLTLFNIVLMGGVATTGIALNGGAISHSGFGNISLTNCVLFNNATSDIRGFGGAIYMDGTGVGGTLTLLNCTVAGNVTHQYGSIYVAGNSKAVLHNTIISNNLNNLAADTYNYDVHTASATPETLTVVTSLIGALAPTWTRVSVIGSYVGTAAKPAEAKFTVNPTFSNGRLTNASTLDLTLTTQSYAINHGNNTFVGQPGYLAGIPSNYQNYNAVVLSKDLAGNDRIFYSTVDIGAYEYNGSLQVETPSTIVTTWNDVVDPFDGLISLREAIAYAGSSHLDVTGKTVILGTTVTFNSLLVGTAITLDPDLGPLTIDKTVTIDASSLPGGITLDAAGQSRVLNVAAEGKDVVFMYVTFTGGDAKSEGGGAIYHSAGNLTLINSLIFGNTATRGGAIHSVAGLTSGFVKLVNCTVTKNNAYVATVGDTGGYGGIYAIRANVILQNTIVALNTTGYNFQTPKGSYTYADLVANGFFTVDNYIGNGSYQASLIGIVGTWDNILDKEKNTSGNLAGTAINPLNPVFVNWDSNNFRLNKYNTTVGGIDVLVNSPAINAGENALAVGPDGKALSRDLSGGIRFMEKIDMGIYESEFSVTEIPSIIVTTVDDIVDPTDGLISLREAVAYAGTYGLGTTITFMQALSGKTFYLNEQLYIDKTITIDGASLGTDITLTIKDVVTDQRIIYVNSGTVNLISLTITNRISDRAKRGQTVTIDQGGAIYLRSGSLTLYNVLLYDNQATSGGAIYVNNGEKVLLNLVNTTVTTNRATDAAVVGGDGLINIKNSILARNITNANNEDVIGNYIRPANSFIQYSDSILSAYGTGYYGNFIGNALVSLKNEAENYLFVDWNNNNFRLKDTSLATNAGENVYTLRDKDGKIVYYGMTNFSGVDLEGNKRLIGQTIDMGAYENQRATDGYYWVTADEITVTTNFDVVNAADGLISLREAVLWAERLYDVGIIKPITFSSYHLGTNPTMVLDTMSITITRSMTIDATGIYSFRINANHANNILRVDVDTTKYAGDVRIVNFELFNGNAAVGGAIYHARGDLVLLNTLIHSNVAKYSSSSTGSYSYGGGIYSAAGNLTLVNCTVANNSADRGGGIYVASESHINLYNSIVAKNIVNQATQTTDVDLALATGASYDIQYTLLGNVYSLRSLNGVNNNLVGYGDDYSVDPYFVSINDGNFRLQPSVNGEVNPALKMGNLRFVSDYNFYVDLDGNPIGNGTQQIFAQGALDYFDRYMESIGSKPVDPTQPYPNIAWNTFDAYLRTTIAKGNDALLIEADLQSQISPAALLDSYRNDLVNYDNAYSTLWFLYRYVNGAGINMTPIARNQRILWSQQYDTVSYVANILQNYLTDDADDFLTWLRQVNGAGVEATFVSLLLQNNDNLQNLNDKLWNHVDNGSEKARLRALIAPGGVLIANTTNGLQAILDSWKDDATIARQLYYAYYPNPCNNIKVQNHVFGNIFQSQAFRDELLAYFDAPIDVGTYQVTREKFLINGKIVVTTLDDVVNPFDGLISLREAVGYATNNRYYYYEPTTGSSLVVGYSGVGGAYNSSASMSEFYSNPNLIINRCPITFADSLAGGTIYLNSDIMLTGYAYYDAFTGTVVYGGNVVWYYYFDATSLAALGGITIDASRGAYAFQVRGAKHPTLNQVSVTYAEFEGITITGARQAGVFVDEYSVLEMRNCLLYRNAVGVYVEDDATMSTYYGVAHLYNVTIANNTRYGIMNYGKFHIHNSIISLNDIIDVYSYPYNNAGNTPPPAYRTVDMYNSLYGEHNGNIYYFNVANRGNLYISDPLFVDEANDDYHLSVYALGINMANSSYLARNRPTHATAQTDLDGKTRTQCGRVDMGAYENSYVYDVPSTVVTTELDIVDATDGLISLREAIAYAEQYQYLFTALFTPAITNTVTFAPALAGKTITLNNGIIKLVNDITIDARSLAAQGGIVIDGNRKSGIFQIDIANSKYGNYIVESRINVNLYGMKLTGGYATDGGAVYIASGNVLIQNCDIYGNEATGHGGAIYIYRNELTLRNVNIGGNIASHYGGVVSNQGRILMENTYIAENRARVSGADYDFYYFTISNGNGNGSNNNVFGKTRNLDLIGHGAPPAGDTNWISWKDNIKWDNFDPDSVFAGSWVGDTWVGTLTRAFVPPVASPAALPELFASFSDEEEIDNFFADILD